MGDFEVLEDIPTQKSSASAAKFSDPTGPGTINGGLDEDKCDNHEHISFQNADDVKENIHSSSLASSKSEPNIVQLEEISLPKLKTCPNSAGDSPTRMQPRNLESHTRSNSIDSSRVVVDTAAPIESVKDAVSKFGGIVDWKTHKVQALERCRHIDQELEKTQEKMMECRKRSQAAENAKMEVLTELEKTMKQIDELESRIQEQRQTTDIAEVQPDEMHHVTSSESHAAAKQELEAIVAQHEATLHELKSLKEELEAEKTVLELTAELAAAKESLDAAKAECREAEDQKTASIVSSEQNMLIWEREVKQVEAEVEKLEEENLLAKDLKSKLDSASALVSCLETELATYVNSKMMELGSPEKELEMVKLKTDKATADVSFLKEAGSSLQSELEKEKEGIALIKKHRETAVVSVQSLEAELCMTKSEIALVEMRSKEAKEKLEDLPSKLQQAAVAADRTKSYRQAVQEELRRARDEAEQVKAEACTSQRRLDATKKEIDATKASEKLALAAINTLQETETVQSSDDVDSANVVVISLKEYEALSKRAQEAEEQAKIRMVDAFIQLEEAKKSESTSLQQLEIVSQEFSAEKESYATATKMSEKAKNDKLGLEEELRAWRSRNLQRRNASDQSACVTTESVMQPVYSPWSIKQWKDAQKSGKVVATEPLHQIPSIKSARVDQGNVEYDSSQNMKIVKRRKRSLFPRLLMYIGLRRNHGLKKVV